jgi:protein TonB
MAKQSTSAQRNEPDAVVVAFPVRADARILSAVPRERRIAPAPERRSFGLAIVLSLVLHVAALAGLQSRTENDLERTLGNAAMPTAEGTVVVIPVEVVAESALPSAAVPTNTTALEAQRPNPIEAAEPKKPALEPQSVSEPVPNVPPPPLAAEVPAEERVAPLPDAKAPDWRMVEEKNEPKPVETPRPVEEKTAPKEVQRTEARPAAPSVAAAPARPAASAAPGRAGNRGGIETGGAAVVSSYQAQVQAHLQRFRSYPEAARSRGITGVATVRFALGRNGQILSVSLVRGSGASVLDEAALAVVRSASPFPPFPAGLGRARMDFATPMRFDLR